MMRSKTLIFCFFIISFGLSARGQSGGAFTIPQSVIAAGGAQQTTGGVFSLDATTGQALAGGASSGGIIDVRDGFWASSAPPTAAGVRLGGRVRTAAGNGIRHVIITLTNPDGTVRTIQSGTFGLFSFNNISVGGTYIISVASRRYSFNRTTQICTVYEEINDLEFIAADL